MSPLQRDLELWASPPDEELARTHGVSPAAIRELRDQMDRDMLTADLMRYARYIARLTETSATLGDIIRRAVLHEARRLEQAEVELAEAMQRRHERYLGRVSEIGVRATLAEECRRLAASKMQGAAVRRAAPKGLTVAPRATVGASGHRDPRRRQPQGDAGARCAIT